MARNRWYLGLTGDEFDLETLAEFLASGAIVVAREDDAQWYLSGAIFDGIEDASAVRDRGIEMVEIINGAGVLFNLEKIKVGSVLEVTDSGEHKHSVLVAETLTAHARCRAVVMGPEGKPKENENALAFRRILKLAGKKPVSDVLHFLTLQPNWWNLYKVFEVVEDDVNGRVYKLVDEQKLRDFKSTAQSRNHLGDEARHASSKKKYSGPLIPTSFEEAQELIRQLVEKWLQQHRGAGSGS